MRKDVFYRLGIKDSAKAVSCFYVVVKIRLRREITIHSLVFNLIYALVWGIRLLSKGPSNTIQNYLFFKSFNAQFSWCFNFITSNTSPSVV